MGRLQLRAWEGDLQRWQETSIRSGYTSVSEWIRQTLNRQVGWWDRPEGAVYGRSTLDNGVRVITESLPDTGASVIGIVVAGGAQLEQPEEGGLSQLCPQMVFEGTATRDGYRIARDLEAVGGESGVIAGRDYHGLFISVSDEYAYPALDLLGDLLLEPAFPAAAWEAERSLRKQQWVAARRATPGRYLRASLRQAGCGEPDGEGEPLGNCTAAQASAFWRRRLQAENVVVVAAGGVRHQEFVAQANDVFWRVRGDSAGSVSVPPARHGGGVLLCEESPGNRSYFCCAIPAPGYLQPERIVWQVWQKVLGGGLASRLNRQLQEREQLVYSIRSDYQYAARQGVFWVEGSTTPGNLFVAVQAVLLELYRLGSNRSPVTEDELVLAKTQLRAELLRSMADLRGRMMRLAVDELYTGRRVPLADRLEEVEALRQDTLAGLRFTLLDRMASVDLGIVDPSEPAGSFAKDRAALPRFLVSFRGRCRRGRRRR